MRLMHAVLGACAAFAIAAAMPAEAQTKLTIATVNNGDMIRMQKLTGDFQAKNPGIDLNWVTLEENALRQKVTTDIATKGGQFDVLTIGTYEVPIWAKQNWLVPLDNLGPTYDVNDILPPIRAGLSANGKLYAAPFYGESSMIMYRRDLFDKAGLTMPAKPDWDFIQKAAAKITDKANEVYGICLRGKPGWGENMAFLTTMANAFGGRWFDEKWHPEFNGPEWQKTLSVYLDLMKNYGPPGATSNGFNENLALVPIGQVRDVDRRHRRRLVRQQPEGQQGRGQGRLRARALRRDLQECQLAVVMGPGHPVQFQEAGGGGEVHRLGHQQGLHWRWSRPRMAGPTCRPARGRRSMRIPHIPLPPRSRRRRWRRSTRPIPVSTATSSRSPISACSSRRSRNSRASPPPSGSNSPRPSPAPPSRRRHWRMLSR